VHNQLIMNNKTVLAFTLAAAMLVLVSAGCKKEDKKSVKDTVQNYAQSGSWRITRFIDSGTDETYHFTGFNFTFQSNGALVATNGSVTYSGTWSITDSNSNDDSKDDLHFNINFNLTNDFEDLNDDWHILSYAASKIELLDESGGGSGTDYLTFEKN